MATVELPHEQVFVSGLDEDRRSCAYHCGRLLTICQHIQVLAADRELDSTFVSRYYAAASARPLYALVPIFKRTRARLDQIKSSKLRADVEALLTRTHNSIDKFPRSLGLVEQGDFQLGYFHQRPGLPSLDLRRRLPTKHGHPVQSAGEQFIDDVLFSADIEHHHSSILEIPGENRPMRPDFTIPLHDNHVLFIEYAGMIENESYDAQWEWKRSRYSKELGARTYEEVMTNRQIAERTLLVITPNDLYSRGEGKQRILTAVTTLQQIAQGVETSF